MRTPSVKAAKKVKKPEALKMMSDYYQANKSSLPKSIVDHREVIVELLMAGVPAEDAFSKAKSNGA